MRKLKLAIFVSCLLSFLVPTSNADIYPRACTTSGITIDELGLIAPDALRVMKQDGATKAELREQFDELVLRLISNYKNSNINSEEDQIILYDPNNYGPRYPILGGEYKRYVSHLFLGNLAHDLELTSRAKQNLLEAIETWMGHTGHGTHFVDGIWAAKQPDPRCRYGSIDRVLGLDRLRDDLKIERSILEVRVQQLSELSNKLDMSELSQALYNEYLAPDVLPTQIVTHKPQPSLPQLSLGELMQIAKKDFEN